MQAGLANPRCKPACSTLPQCDCQMCDASCRPCTLLRRRATLPGSSSPSGRRHHTARRASP
eukprot:1736071-Amphidinium_carterae.1